MLPFDRRNDGALDAAVDDVAAASARSRCRGPSFSGVTKGCPCPTCRTDENMPPRRREGT